MKFYKTIAIFAVVCFSLFLSSCVVEGGIHLSSTQEVERIELIKYCDPDVKANPKGEYEFKDEILETIETLSGEERDRFVDEFYIYYRTPLVTPKLHSPYGTGIKITYDNGDFQIITLTVLNDSYYIYNGFYNPDGTKDRGYDLKSNNVSIRFIEFIQKYFKTPVEFTD